MANLKTIQFLRSSQVYENLAAAKAALIGVTGLTDGSPVVARYLSGTTEMSVLGIAHVNGSTTGVTIFESAADIADRIAQLQTELDAAETAVGLNADGTKAAQTGAYIADKTTVEAEIKALNDVIEAMDYGGVTTGDGVVLTNATQADGKIAATSANVGNLKLTDYAQGTASGDVASTDSINQAVAKLQNQAKAEIAARTAAIEALDYTDTAVTGSYVSAVNETDGKISVTRVALPTVAAISEAGKPITAVSETLGEISATAGTIQAQYVTTDTTDKDFTGATVQAALEEISSKVKANEITNTDGSITVTPANGSSTDIKVNIKSGEKVIALDANKGGIYTELDLVKITTGLPETVKERYQLLATDDSQIGVNIDVPKDSHIVSINYITKGEHAQNLEYVYIDASGNTQTTYVDMSSLVIEAEFASGVTAIDHVVRGVVDPSSESFFTVGENGFKVAGISGFVQTEIEKLDATVGSQTIATGKHVAVEVAEADGKLTALTVTENDIASAQELADEITARTAADTELSNRLGSDVTTANTASAQLAALSGNSSTDTSATTSVEGAKRYADNIVSSTVENLDADVSGNSTHVTVGVVEENGKITAVTVSESNIANADALAAEIAARKAVDGQNGDTYAANTSANYISDAGSLNDADVKLDAALKTADDAMLTSVAAGNGISVSTKNEKSQTITAVAKTNDPVIEVTSNGIGVKEDAVWDCGTF